MTHSFLLRVCTGGAGIPSFRVISPRPPVAHHLGRASVAPGLRSKLFFLPRPSANDHDLLPGKGKLDADVVMFVEALARYAARRDHDRIMRS